MPRSQLRARIIFVGVMWGFFSSCNLAAHPIANIIVAMYIEPPFSDIVDGKFVGENIDIANALAAKADKKISFVYCPPARCFALLESGQADMMIAIRKTTLRKNFLLYLEPAINIQHLPLQFYIHANNKIEVNSYEDLRPLKIGVLRGASYFDRFDYDTELTKIPLSSYQQLVDMLLKGRIDTFLEREETIMPWVDQEIYKTQIKLARFAYEQGVGSYIAIAKNSPLALEVSHFSQALQALSDSGELATILKK